MPFVVLNKPFHVLSQFTSDGDRDTLASYVDVPNVYPAGRLDYDSEGLLVLTDDGALQARISHPRSGCTKTYLAQIEGTPTAAQLKQLVSGVRLKDGPARALRAQQVDEPTDLWPRNPPVRYRKSVPDAWLRIDLQEGRNRQVRRMTAAVGLPTLRLIRQCVGPFSLDKMAPGETRILTNKRAWARLQQSD